MRGSTLLFFIVAAAIGGWLFFGGYAPGTNFRPIAHYGQPGTPTQVQPTPSATPGVSSPLARANSAPIADFLPRDPRFVRVASFNVEMTTQAKADNPATLRRIASILAQFDVVALQGVAANESHTVGQLVDLINNSGRQYDYVLGPRVGRDEDNVRQLAYVFDLGRVEIDKQELYTVEDPDDLLRWEPLVAWFRTRGPHPNDAFTFTLINVESDPDEKDRENAILGNVFREVRNDLRQEDDVVMTGSFLMSSKQLGQLARLPNPDWAVTTEPTNTRGDSQMDNVVSNRNFTDEATGRSGVVDFLRFLNLSLEQANSISSHFPVWAEFSMTEGGPN